MPERGELLESERVFYADPDTGAQYIQLTQAAVHSRAPYFEFQSFTHDDKSLVFLSMRHAGRGAAWDVYCVDIDGNNLYALSDEEHPLESPVPAHDSRRVFGLRGDRLLSIDLDSFEEIEIVRVDEVKGMSNGSLSRDNRFYMAIGHLKSSGKSALIRMATDGSDVAIFAEGVPVNHLDANNSAGLVSFNGMLNDQRGPMIINIDGSSLRHTKFRKFAHSSWYGDTPTFQGTLLPPGHGIVIAGPDDEEPRHVCKGGPYFWHSGSSWDDEWIVADTNWPDEGLMLVHVPSGRYQKLSSSKSNNANPQYCHPHPSFNRAGDRVIYTSNRTGISQVYIVTVSDEIREELRSGELSNRHRRQ